MASPRAALLSAALLLCPSAVSAQGWSVDLYAGSSIYEPAAEDLRATSLIAGLRHGTPEHRWIYAAVAAPLSDDALAWAAAGGSYRLRRPLRTGLALGLDAGAHGYVYRDDVVRVTGTGVTLDAGASVDAALRQAHVMLRAGLRHYLADDGPVHTSRSAPEGSVRVEPVLGGPVSAGATLRVIHVEEGTYPAAGADMSVLAGPLRIWAAAERWLDRELDDFAWSVNAGVPAGRFELWAGVREEARDPLYWNAGRRSWSAGLSFAIGGSRPAPLVVAPAPGTSGETVLRVPRTSSHGVPSVAGDFSGWALRPMNAAGEWWEIRMQLPPGAYHFAFVDGNGRWFVPEDTPGRMDDGMGGHVAVLVVP